MNLLPTTLPGVLIVEPKIFPDPRGFFLETYNRVRYQEAGIGCEFMQDNLSASKKGTLRGLHYQYPNAQAKLVQVIQGEVFDVAVDIRKGSPTFGKWTGVLLSADNKRQLFIPQGFAHGFCVLSETAIFNYKCSDFYAPQHEHGILWSDPAIHIDWPVANPILSPKDRAYPVLKEILDKDLPSI